MDEELIDEWIGEYHIIGFRSATVLGHGGSSTVFRAYKKDNEEEVVALKRMHDPFPNYDAALKEKILKEVDILEMLDHDHIVKLIEVIFEDTDYGQMARPCIVMPYVPGGTLRKLLTNNDLLPLETIRSYMRQITDALSYAHSHRDRVVHCDVKPENILLSEDGNKVFLTDFGIAQITSEIRSTTHVTTKPSGTDIYMAPEQFKGHPSRKSDQYALAIVLYECLCGSPPFEGANYGWLSEQHHHAQVPSLRQKCRSRGRNISKRTERVVLTALAKKKEKRYLDIKAFAEALDKALTLEIKIEEERHHKAEQAYQAKEEQYTSTTKIIVWSVGVILIVLSLFVFIRAIYDAQAFYEGTKTTQGIIIYYDASTVSDGSTVVGSCSISVTFTPVGKTSPITIQENGGLSTCGEERGKKVEVLYHPSNPTDAKTTEKASEDIWTTILGLLLFLPMILVGTAKLANKID